MINTAKLQIRVPLLKRLVEVLRYEWKNTFFWDEISCIIHGNGER